MVDYVHGSRSNVVTEVPLAHARSRKNAITKMGSGGGRPVEQPGAAPTEMTNLHGRAVRLGMANLPKWGAQAHPS